MLSLAPSPEASWIWRKAAWESPSLLKLPGPSTATERPRASPSVARGSVGCPGGRTSPGGVGASALAVPAPRGFGGLRAAPVHFRVHVLFGGFLPTPSCLGKLLCLGRDPRVEERSPHSASEHSGFNFCSAQVLRTGGLHFSGTGLRVLTRKERGRRRLVTAPSNVRRGQAGNKGSSGSVKCAGAGQSEARRVRHSEPNT